MEFKIVTNPVSPPLSSTLNVREAERFKLVGSIQRKVSAAMKFGKLHTPNDVIYRSAIIGHVGIYTLAVVKSNSDSKMLKALTIGHLLVQYLVLIGLEVYGLTGRQALESLR